MEHATFRKLLAGQEVPRLFCFEADRDGDSTVPFPTPEYARRMGHVDLFRERIDGR